MGIRNTLESIIMFYKGVISNIQSMSLGAYAAVAAMLVLLLMMLILRRIKPLFWFFFAAAAAFGAYMLYYVISGIKILLFIRLDNMLGAYDKWILQMMGLFVLGFIVLIGLISIIVGTARSRRKKAAVIQN